jgi:hypothetical protein
LKYDSHAYHHIAAFNGMIEPQQDGHLHWHLMLYSSVLSPELLEKAAAASSMALQTQIGNMLDSITCTTIPCEIHQWYNDILSSVQHGSKCPRGADIEVPNASSNFDNFISIRMKKSHLNGMHSNGFCCEKGKKDKFMCRLVFKRGIQTRTSYMEHLPPTCYTIQFGKHHNKTICRRTSLPCGRRYHCNAEGTK